MGQERDRPLGEESHIAGNAGCSHISLSFIPTEGIIGLVVSLDTDLCHHGDRYDVGKGNMLFLFSLMCISLIFFQQCAGT